MEIVIKLPEDAYKKLEQKYRNGKANVLDCIILNGIVLPKGHGRLIDADELYEKSRLCHTEEDGTACVEWREINDAPTIIDASDSERQ